MQRLLKKLSVLLLFCMLFTVFASAAFTDQNEIRNKDAVSYLIGKGILGGYSDNSFRPDKTVTRAEFAKMVYVMEKGTPDVKAYTGKAPFTDIGSHWAKGYISALYDEGVISGNGGAFSPDGALTGYEMAKMLLAATGTDTDKAGLTGIGWMLNTQTLASEKGFLKNYTLQLSDAVTRDFAALMIYNAMTGDEDSPVNYQLCAVTSIENDQVSILGQDGRKASYALSEVSLSPDAGEIYYYKTEDSRLILQELNSVVDKSVTYQRGAQTYWSGNQVVTIDGKPYETDENTVVFIKHNRRGLPGSYTYDFSVYKARSLRSVYAGSADSVALLGTADGKTTAKLIVCDMDTYNASKRSATGIAYVTGDTVLFTAGEGQYMVSYPMFAGRDKEPYFVADTKPSTIASLKGSFVTYELNSQGRLKSAPAATPVPGLSLSHGQGEFVLGEITAYNRNTGKIQIKASGADQVFAFAENYNIVYLDTSNTEGVSGGSITNGNGKLNCVYFANADGRILYLFVDVNGQIQ